jgi:hypothetical protein
MHPRADVFRQFVFTKATACLLCHCGRTFEKDEQPAAAQFQEVATVELKPVRPIWDFMLHKFASKFIG